MSKQYVETSPFSWVNCYSCKNILDILENKFEHFLENQLPKGKVNDNTKDIYKINEYSFAHYNMCLSETIKSFERKIQRFLSYINDDTSNILFVYINEDYIFNEDYRDYDDENYEYLKKINDYLSLNYPKLKFTIFNIVFKKRENYKNIDNIFYIPKKFKYVNLKSKTKVYPTFRKECQNILKNYINGKVSCV